MTGECARNDGRGAAESNVRATLDNGIEKLGLAIDAGARAALIAYVELLARWNRSYNLTAIRAPRAMVTRLLLDSLSALPWVAGDRLLDIGSGAGIPGLAFAIVRPELHCVLLDSNGKKTRFCVQAVNELGLANVEVVCARLADYAPGVPFDTVVSRAALGLETLLAASLNLLAPDGRLLAFKGPQAEAEFVTLGAAGTIERLYVPGLDAERRLVVCPRSG